MAFWCKKSQIPAFCTVPYTELYFTVYMVRNCINTVLHHITVPYRITVHCTVLRTGTILTVTHTHTHTQTSGTGKSELINSLLERPAAKTNAFTEATKRIRVRKGLLHGIQVRGAHACV